MAGMAGRFALEPPAGASSPGRVNGVQRLRARVVWRWCRWTRLPLTPAILVVAALTVVVDVTTAWLDIGFGHLGRVSVSPAILLGVVLAIMVGTKRLGLDRANLHAWREFLVVSGTALALRHAPVLEEPGRHPRSVRPLARRPRRRARVPARGADPRRRGVRGDRPAELAERRRLGVGPGIVALVAAGLVFTLLPGHVAQISDGLHALPFACLGLVLGYAVLRAGALLPAAVVHALLNLATIAAFEGEVSPAVRTALAASALSALVLATIVAGVRLGILRPFAVEDTPVT